MITALVIVAGFLLGWTGNWIAGHHPEFALWWFGSNAALCIVASASALVAQDYPVAAGCAFGAALSAWMWWKHWLRRKKRGALATAGAKSRARLARLTGNVRESAKPRRVRIPDAS